MANKQSESGSRPLQLTIVFAESDIALEGTNDGTGPTQTLAVAGGPALPVAPVLPVNAPAASPPSRARSTTEATGKTERKRKWYSLWDKVYALPNLRMAWERVAANKGAGGIDGLTIEMFSRNAERRLEALSRDLQAKTYRPKPVRRVYIPKAGGGTRPLGIPAIHDRIVQQALLQILTPIFEPKFSDRSHGFRPGLGCHSALTVVDRAVRYGYNWVVDADIKGFFDNVDHGILLAAIAEEISDGSVLTAIRQILEAGVIEPDSTELEPSELGTPQGGPLSPLLANIYLHRLDSAMGGQWGLIRYADDFVIFARSEEQAIAALRRAREILEGELKLQLHPEKTRVVTVDEGFEFLGFRYIRRKNGLLIKQPRSKSLQKFRDTVRGHTPRLRNQRKPKPRSFTLARLRRHRGLSQMIRELNVYLRSWYGYFYMSWLPPHTAFDRQDSTVRRCLRQALTGRVGNGWWNVVIKNEHLAELGLISLQALYQSDPRVRYATVSGRKA